MRLQQRQTVSGRRTSIAVVMRLTAIIAVNLAVLRLLPEVWVFSLPAFLFMVMLLDLALAQTFAFGQPPAPPGVPLITRHADQASQRAAPQAISAGGTLPRLYTSVPAGAGVQYCADYRTPQESWQAGPRAFSTSKKQGKTEEMESTHSGRKSVPGRLPPRGHDRAVHRASDESPPQQWPRVRRLFTHCMGL